MLYWAPFEHHHPLLFTILVVVGRDGLAGRDEVDGCAELLRVHQRPEPDHARGEARVVVFVELEVEIVRIHATHGAEASRRGG